MVRSLLSLSLLSWLWAAAASAQTPPPLQEPARTPIRGAHYPALSPDGKRLCFEYLGDLWTVSSEGGLATRLTVHPAYDAYPRWSPDGRWIAFSSNREGNFDVFLIPARGGTARQLTFHTADDYMLDWSPDGTEILFASSRESRFVDLYTLRIQDNRLCRVTHDGTASRYGVFSPDGKTIAYARGRQEWWRPRYHGSANTDIFTIPAQGGKTTRWTDYDGFDSFPLYAPKGGLYFVSDRSGASNLWHIGAPGARPEQITHHARDAVRFPTISRDGTRVVYECNFQLWSLPVRQETRSAASVSTPKRDGLLEISSRGISAPLRRKMRAPARRSRDAATTPYPAVGGTSFGPTASALPPSPGCGTRPSHSRRADACGPRGRGLPRPYMPRTPLHHGEVTTLDPQPVPIDIYAPTDFLTNVKERVTLDSGATSLSLSPNGETFAFAARGALWTLPVGGGEATLLMKPNRASYAPVWSSDGAKLAYTNDRAGNLDVYLLDLKTRAETPLTADPADETDPKFSANGRLLAYVRAGGAEPGLYVLPLPSDGVPKPSDAVRVGPGPGVGAYDWSPDSRWIVYSKRDATGSRDLWIVPSVGGTPVNVTRYPGANTDPHWTRDGRYIVFLSTRDSAPGSFQANLYSLRLIPPIPRDESGAGSDEATGSDDAQFRRRRPPPAAPDSGGDAAFPEGGLPGGAVPALAASVSIEFEDIQNRAHALTSTRDSLMGGNLSPDSRTVLYAVSAEGRNDWWAADLVSGRTVRVTNGAEVGGSVVFAPDATRAYYLTAGGAIRELARRVPQPLPVSFAAAMEVDRRAELAEAFNEAWRLLRTQFYDPRFHGADWLALRAKYEPLLAETWAEEDFAWLLQAMIGELNASHVGATPPSQPSAATGYLGLTFDQDYAGPGLRVADVLPKGPADQIGRHVEVGQYVLAIDGQDVVWNEPMYRTLLDKAGKTVELLVNDKPTRMGAHTVRVQPITRQAYGELDYARWVEKRRRKVDALSGGQLAYIHIQAMDQPSLRRFEREIFGDAQSKKGLVLDVRFNGGGRTHDELLAILRRRAHVFEVPRDAERSTQPFQVWDRPTILLINEYSASDAEIFPNGFREYGLGKLVGVPTYGAVIGTRDVTLVDGTRFRVPTSGWYTLGGKDLENYGVPPDIRVEMTPEDYAADRDPQLDAAVKELLAEMVKR